MADVVKSFDTVDRGILDFALGRLGLLVLVPTGLLELATGLGEAWTREDGIPQGCPLSMVSSAALHVLWCRYLSNCGGVLPQLHGLLASLSHGVP